MGGFFVGLKYEKLIRALQRYNEEFGRGANAELAEMARIDPNIVSRIVRGKTSKPSIETWDALHDAVPEHIPPPEFDREYNRPKKDKDSGCPMADECFVAQAQFFGYIKNGAMEPGLRVGDLVVVDPSAKPEPKKLCYVAGLPGDKGPVDVVRRFNRFGKTIVLTADNDDYPDIVVEEKKSTRGQIQLFAVTHRLCKE